MKGHGRTISNMEAGTRCFPTVQSTRATTSTASPKVLESMSGRMGKPMRGSGSTVSNMAVVCGREQKGTAMWGSGGWERRKDMGFMFG